jgi:hypothetical protein
MTKPVVHQMSFDTYLALIRSLRSSGADPFSRQLLGFYDNFVLFSESSVDFVDSKIERAGGFRRLRSDGYYPGRHNFSYRGVHTYLREAINFEDFQSTGDKDGYWPREQSDDRSMVSLHPNMNDRGLLRTIEKIVDIAKDSGMVLRSRKIDLGKNEFLEVRQEARE